jgi:hypothetical protein
MRWRFRQPREERPGDSIADEAEQFLAGGYLDIAFVNERDVPAWIWMSTLAHADGATLERAEHWLDHQREMRPELELWGRMLQLLARRVHESYVAIGCSLEDLQREVLVPLELAVSAASIGPATLYRIVDSMLAEVTNRIHTNRA